MFHPNFFIVWHDSVIQHIISLCCRCSLCCIINSFIPLFVVFAQPRATVTLSFDESYTMSTLYLEKENYYYLYSFQQRAYTHHSWQMGLLHCHFLDSWWIANVRCALDEQTADKQQMECSVMQHSLFLRDRQRHRVVCLLVVWHWFFFCPVQ